MGSKLSRKGALGLALETLRQLLENRVLELSAALAYYSALSLAPLLIITFGITGMVIDRQVMQQHVVRDVERMVGPEGADLIRTLAREQHVMGAGIWATTAGFAMLLLGASAVFAQLQEGLNTIWGVGPGARRGLLHHLRKRLVSMAMIFCLGLLLLASMLASTFVSAMSEHLGSLPGPGNTLTLVTHFVTSLAITAAIFALIFKLVPQAAVAWGDAWSGAALTAVLFQVGTWGIGQYVGHAAVGSAYGAAGSVVVLLVWVYYAALIVFTGAQFARVRATRSASPARP